MNHSHCSGILWPARSVSARPNVGFTWPAATNR